MVIGQNKIFVQTDSCTYEGYTTNLKPIFIKTNDFYLSVRANKIYNIQGAINGKPLNGKVISYYYPSGAIKESGKVRLGRKVGKWKRWDLDGNLVSTYKQEKTQKTEPKNPLKLKLTLPKKRAKDSPIENKESIENPEEIIGDDKN